MLITADGAISIDQSSSGPSNSNSSSSRSPRSKRPKKIGRFEILKKLGAGGFGIVYLAFDSVLDREVALKLPHNEILQSSSAARRFLREAKTSARLTHPYIVQVYDAGQVDNKFFIASRFVKGVSLDEYVSQKGALEAKEAATIVGKLAEAVHYAHSRGIIHRDIKPHNIMIDDDGEPYLMDFGLARLETDRDKITKAGAVIGTPAYMAPEQASSKKTDQVGPLSDQYSLGAVLYELLTGQAPFSGPVEVVLYNVISNEPDPITSHAPTVPLDLQTICAKAMCKEANQRFENCQDFAEDLERLLDDRPITARRVGSLEKSVRWVKRNPLAGSLILAVLLVTTVGFASTAALLQISNQQREEAVEAKNLAVTNEAEAKRQQKIAEKREAELLKQANELLAAQQRSEQMRILADTQKALAEEKAAEAEKQTSLLLAEKQESERQRTLVAENKKIAEFAQEKGELATYTRRLEQVADAISEENYREANQLFTGLSKTFDTDENRHLLDWEYYFLKNYLVQQSGGFDPVDSDIVDVSVSHDGTRVFSLGSQLCCWNQQPLKILSQRHSIDLGLLQEYKKIVASRNKSELNRWLEKATGPITAIDSSPTSDGVTVAYMNGLVQVLDNELQPEKDLARLDISIQLMEYSPDGNYLACAGNSFRTSQPEIVIWDVVGNKIASRFDGHKRETRSINFNTDATKIATCGTDGLTRIWSLANGNLLQTLRGHSGVVTGAVFADELGLVLTTGYDRNVYCWNPLSGQKVDRIAVRDVHQSEITSLDFVPHRQMLVTGTKNGTIRCFNLNTGFLIRKLQKHSDWITDLASDLQGDLLVSSGKDNRIHTARLNRPGHINLPNVSGAKKFSGVRMADREPVSYDFSVRNPPWEISENGDFVYLVEELFTGIKNETPLTLGFLSLETGRIANKKFQDEGYRSVARRIGSGRKCLDNFIGSSRSGHRIHVFGVVVDTDTLEVVDDNLVSESRNQKNTKWGAEAAFLNQDSILVHGDNSHVSKLYTHNLYVCDFIEDKSAMVLQNAYFDRLEVSPQKNYLAYVHRAGKNNSVVVVSLKKDVDFIIPEEDRPRFRDASVAGNLSEDLDSAAIRDFESLYHQVIKFSPKDKYLAIAADRVVYLYDTKTLQNVHQLSGHTMPICDVYFTKNGKRIISVDPEYLKVWNLTGSLIMTIRIADQDCRLVNSRIARGTESICGFFDDFSFRLFAPDSEYHQPLE